VRIYNSATLKKVGEIPRTGVVGYNSARDEIGILGPDRIYLVDADTMEITGELCVYGDCSGERHFLPTAVGPQATDLHIFSKQNLIAVEYYSFRAGKPGNIGLPRFFDAVTLGEVTDRVRTAYQLGCQDRPILTEPMEGHIYQSPRDREWLFIDEPQDLVVYDLDGSPQSRIADLPLGVVNPITGQMYSPYDGQELRVIDLPALSPVGLLPCDCIHTLDAASGRIYGMRNDGLVVFYERGREKSVSPTGRAGPLPAGEAITLILPSPNYADDRTIFIGTDAGDFAPAWVSSLYRSTDGGRTWSPLRGGLPQAGGGVLVLALAISPDFSRDHTLFAGGARVRVSYYGGSRGEGIYRSLDGGDTWQPVWQGLTELGIRRLEISPNFAEDRTLFALGAHQVLRSTDGGDTWQPIWNEPTDHTIGMTVSSNLVHDDTLLVHAFPSIYRSTDRGTSWTWIVTDTQTYGPPLETYLPSAPKASLFWLDDRQVRRRSGDRQEWEIVLTLPEMMYVSEGIVFAPDFAASQTLYVYTHFMLLRSTDGGDSWHQWAQDRQAGDPHSVGPEATIACAVSPLLKDGQHDLFLGTRSGQFLVLDPDEMDWIPY
jgi:hypothetical protein